MDRHREENMRRVLMVLVLAMPAAAGDWERVAPWSGVRFEGDAIDVLVAEDWYRLDAIEGVAAGDLVAHAKGAYGRRWQKRIVEDIVEVLAGLSRKTDGTVRLDLVDPATGAEVTRVERLTHDKRRAAKDLFDEEEDRAAPPATLDRAAALRDLERLEWLIENRFAYRDLTGLDRRAAFAAARDALPEQIARADFALRIHRLLARFGDGHAGVAEPLDALLPDGYLPFLVAPAGERIVAFRTDRSGFVDPKRPFLTALDGRPVADWIEAADPLVARGSEALVRHRRIRTLRWLAGLRRELGLPDAPEVKVTLADEKGGARTVALPLAPVRPLYGDWPRTETRRLAADVGYLRIARMDDDPAFLEGLDRAMREFADTRGLVIDVRGNGGGSRAALLRLAPWFLDEGEARIGNVAAYRLESGDPRSRPGGYLADRFLVPTGEEGLSAAARGVIFEAAGKFRPDWRPPEAEFSEWHWLVLERSSNPRAGRYRKPVVLLVDAGCFSATDVFAGALAEFPRVTLVGGTTSGGSGRARSHLLPESGLAVRLSTMASFRPDGRRYDGLGVEPDVPAGKEPGDRVGESDAQLARALEVLKDAIGKRKDR
jgi:hypothetical protein